MYMKKSILTFFTCLCLLILSSCNKEDATEQDLLKSGALVARVYDAGTTPEANLPLAPLKNALVTLKNADRSVASLLTDATGQVLFDHIPEGEYLVEITKSGYAPLRFDRVSVKENVPAVLKSDFFDVVFMPRAPKDKKRWTVIHFVNLCDLTINNDLISDIRMVEKNGGSGDSANHVVYIPATNDYTETSRLSYLIKPKFGIENEELYDNEVYKARYFSPTYTFDNYDNSMANPSDYKLLEKAIVSIGNLFPSDSLMLFIYGHGTGIDISYSQTRSISLNRDPEGEITVPQMREVFSQTARKGHKVNALVMAACKMGSFELAYELNGCVDYIVASEDRSLGINYGAEHWVKEFGNGTIPGIEACRRIVRGVGDVNAFAAYDMRCFPELVTRFNALAASLKLADAGQIRPIVEKTMKVTIGSTLNDLIHGCYDLADFAKNLSESTSLNDDLRQKALGVNDYLKEAKPGNLISEFHCSRSDYARGRGMGVLLRAPDQPYGTRNQAIYRQHKYYKDGNTDWDAFLINLDK